MDNKYSERCPISLAFREMKIKTSNPPKNCQCQVQTRLEVPGILIQFGMVNWYYYFGKMFGLS